MKIRVTTAEVRKTLRTGLAVLVTLAALVPVLVELGVVDPTATPWLASLVVGAAFVTRVMQNPKVDELLGKVLGAPFTIDGLPKVARYDAPAGAPVPGAVDDGPGDGSDAPLG